MGFCNHSNLVQMDFYTILIPCKWYYNIYFVQIDISINLVQIGFCNNINLVQMGVVIILISCK